MLSATTNEARTGTQPVAEDGEQSNAPESRIGRFLKSMSLGRDRVIGAVPRDWMMLLVGIERCRSVRLVAGRKP